MFKQKSKSNMSTMPTLADTLEKIREEKGAQVKEAAVKAYQPTMVKPRTTAKFNEAMVGIQQKVVNNLQRAVKRVKQQYEESREQVSTPVASLPKLKGGIGTKLRALAILPATKRAYRAMKKKGYNKGVNHYMRVIAKTEPEADEGFLRRAIRTPRRLAQKVAVKLAYAGMSNQDYDARAPIQETARRWAGFDTYDRRLDLKAAKEKVEKNKQRLNATAKMFYKAKQSLLQAKYQQSKAARAESMAYRGPARWFMDILPSTEYSSAAKTKVASTQS